MPKKISQVIGYSPWLKGHLIECLFITDPCHHSGTHYDNPSPYRVVKPSASPKGRGKPHIDKNPGHIHLSSNRKWEALGDLEHALNKALVYAATTSRGLRALPPWKPELAHRFFSQIPEVHNILLSPGEFKRWAKEGLTEEKPQGWVHPVTQACVFKVEGLPNRSVLALGPPEYIGRFAYEFGDGVLGEFFIDPNYVLGFKSV